MLLHPSALQVGGGTDILTAFAILAIAIGIAGIAILILFSKKKI